MPTFKELTNAKNRFMFRGKIYKFSSYIPVPSIENDGRRWRNIFHLVLMLLSLMNLFYLLTINIRTSLYPII